MTLETELKLSLDPRHWQRLLTHPRLEGKGVEWTVEHLLATYYDTPSLQLHADGIGLRVRRENERWIQTLKTGIGGSGGLHHHEELDSEVESDALDLTKLPVSGPFAPTFADPDLRKALKAVLVTDIERHSCLLSLSNGAKVEVSVDQGHIRAGRRSRRIAEVELELLQGSVASLYALALELAEVVPLRLEGANKAEQGYRLLQRQVVKPQTGSLPELNERMSAEQAFQAIMYRCAEHFQANEEAVLAGDVEGVHQFRVGLRRLRSCLSVFKSVIPAETVAGLKLDIRWLNEVTGPVRDWDVFIEGLEPVVGRFPEHRGLKDFVAAGHAIRVRHDRALCSRLRSPRYGGFLLRLGAWLATAGWRVGQDPEIRELQTQPVLRFARQVLRKNHKRMIREGEDFDNLPTEIKHDLRIRAKRLRYALQFFSSLYGQEHCRGMLKTLSALQDNLGLLNDLVVAERLLDEAGARCSEPTKALIDGWYAARLDFQEGHAGDAWQAFVDASRPWAD